MRNDQNYDYEPSTYRTGSTRPPKSYGGIIALLLVVVIALCGIISMLSIANIRLTRKIQADQEQQELSIINSHTQYDATSPMDNVPADISSVDFPLGIVGESVSTLYQLYYGLPGGVLISKTEHAAIAPGDILLSIDGIRILDADALSQQLAAHTPGDRVQAEFYRAGEQFSVTLTVEETDD